ncbi:hypothetical protein RVR34_16365 [Microcystis aeruginosa FBCC-A68]|uniref:hypothetical protein n=1 Tax=Microcystis aeruginosa TaxID=1126 RepID=UPI0020165926|nr:hypothetical protein [Microcystis aeruginosa]
MKAIVLTCDKYIKFADHMIYTYQKWWPSNPFTFRVPYGDYPENLAKYGDKVELIPMDSAKVIHPIETEKGTKQVSLIRDTVLNLLKDLPDEEWIYSGKRLSEIQTKLCLAWFIARDTVPHTTAHRYIGAWMIII